MERNMDYENLTAVTYNGLPVGCISKWNNLANLTDLK